MELTLHEMNILCQIIDIQKLPSFSSFTFLSKNDSQEAMLSLENKRILENGKLSKHGLQLLDLIQLFAESSRFFKFGDNGLFSNYQNGEFILICKKESIFEIELMNRDAIISVLLSKFKGLKEIKDGKYKKRFLSKQKFSDFMQEHEEIESVFYYKADLKRDIESKVTIFLNEGYLQHYNVVSGELDMYPRELVQKGLENIFVWED